jgi:hypothetical protein
VLGAQQAEAPMGSWSEEMIERGHQQGLEQGLAQGREEGLALGLRRARAASILRIFAVRGIAVDEATRQRILDCKEMEMLDIWFDRAIHATSVSEVLDNRTRASWQKDS